MTDATSPPSAPPDLVQSRRFELVDDLGQARLVLGNLALEADDDYWPGLVIRDVDGHDRVRLMLHDNGVDLEFGIGGNTVAILGVIDPEGGFPDPGARLALCDLGGTPIVGWRVYADSTWERIGSRS